MPSFLSKRFSKGTIIAKTESIHIETNKKKGKHYGVVSESNKEKTIFHIFTHKATEDNKLIDFSKFSNDFGKLFISAETYISKAIFMNETKNIKRLKGGGKYNV